ncbi:MAG: Gfo/Idh/MocA family protein, partial [Bacillota bacterium]
MTKIRAGIIGTGKAARAHIEALRRLGFVEIAGICGSNRAHTEQQARQLFIERVYCDYRDLLSDPDIDVVHVCTTNDRHYEVNKDALLAGKHVVSEKPLAVTPKQARELAIIAKEKGLCTAVMFNYRMYAMVQEARRLVAGKTLGRINLVRGGYLQDWLLTATDFDWRLQTEQGGPGGVLADIASHWCDLVEYISGDNIVAVLADTAVIHRRRRDAQGQWHKVNAPE